MTKKELQKMFNQKVVVTVAKTEEFPLWNYRFDDRYTDYTLRTHDGSTIDAYQEGEAVDFEKEGRLYFNAETTPRFYKNGDSTTLRTVELGLGHWTNEEGEEFIKKHESAFYEPIKLLVHIKSIKLDDDSL